MIGESLIFAIRGDHGFFHDREAPNPKAFIDMLESTESTLAATTTIGVGLSHDDALRSFQSIHAGQANVHGDHVRRDVVQPLQSFLGDFHGRRDLEPGVLFDHLLEEFAHDSRILDDHDANLLHRQIEGPTVASRKAADAT